MKALMSRKAGGPETLTERFPLSRGAEAIARLAAREARGKIVVLVQ